MATSIGDLERGLNNFMGAGRHLHGQRYVSEKQLRGGGGRAAMGKVCCPCARFVWPLVGPLNATRC